MHTCSTLTTGPPRTHTREHASHYTRAATMCNTLAPSGAGAPINHVVIEAEAARALSLRFTACTGASAHASRHSLLREKQEKQIKNSSQ